jgi:hypothetical protein
MNKYLAISKKIKKLKISDFENHGLFWEHPTNVMIFKYYESKSISESHDYTHLNLFKRIYLSLLFFKKVRIIDFKEICVTIATLLSRDKENVFYYFDNFDLKVEEKKINPYLYHPDDKSTKLIYVLGEFEKKNEDFVRIDLLVSFLKSIRPYKQLNIKLLVELKKNLENSCANKVMTDLNEIYNLYRAFKLLFTFYKPKVINIYDSYNIYNLALIAACKKKNIKIIEHQHGIFSPFHFGYYYKFSSLRAKDFVSDIFQSYTPEIIEWCKPNWNFPPQITINKSSPSYKNWEHFASRSSNSIIKKIRENNNKIVLFTFTDNIQPWVLNSIHKMLEIGCFLYLRPHPRYSESITDTLIKQFKNSKSIDFEVCSSISIFELFQNVDYVISDTSSTLVDSIGFCKHIICTSAIGSELYFKPYIHKKMINIKTDNDQLIQYILTSDV